ncbi:shikimate 5-dehydrogenase [Dyadobacter frigoris]|nr:shikimate 5-dehydrogenase [Dyadobacter frigoris]
MIPNSVLMDLYGLIGFPLTHSFSKRYFSEKFVREGILNCSYDLYEMPKLENLSALLKRHPELKGLNVTIPYKQDVIPFLDDLDDASAERIGAVNTIKVFADGSTKGYNTDYYGFRQSISEWMDRRGEACCNFKALVLGNGGAAQAVKTALEDMKTEYVIVSRQKSADSITYEELTQEIMESHLLIINTTPLGTFPNTETCPEIPYQFISKGHFMYDLVYNPTTTLFMKNGAAQGAVVHNGLKMLEMQAEKAWDIWTSEEEMWSV